MKTIRLKLKYPIFAPTMESRRQQKFARLIQKELGEIFQQDIKSEFSEGFITVTAVHPSPDLGLARVYLSFLMSKDKQKALDEVTAKAKAIRGYLSARIGKQVRIIPELAFYYDDSQEYASKMDKLLAGLNIPPAEQDE